MLLQMEANREKKEEELNGVLDPELTRDRGCRDRCAKESLLKTDCSVSERGSHNV